MCTQKSNHYKIIDYSTNNNLKLYLSTDKCIRLQFYILCVAENDSEDCSTLSFDPQYQGNVFEMYKLISNDTAAFYYFNIENLSLGTHEISINSKPTIFLTCLAPDLSKISFQLTNDRYYLYPTETYFSMNSMGAYEVIGDYDKSFDTSLLSGYGNGYSGFSPLPGVHSQILIASIPTSSVLSPLILSVYSNNTPTDYNIVPISNNIFDNIYDVKTYPDLKYLTNLDTLGLGQGAVLEFKMNNTANTPFTINVNGSRSSTMFHPIYGDESSTTYLYPLKYDATYLYEIYCFNNNQFKKSPISIEAKVNTYKYQILTPSASAPGLYPNGLNTITFGFTDTKLYDFPLIRVNVEDFEKSTRFPFGYTQGSPSGFKYSINSIVGNGMRGITMGSLLLTSNVGDLYIFATFPYNDLYPSSPEEYPVVTDYQFIHLVDDKYILRLKISAPNSLYYIETGYERFYSKVSLVDGDLNIGTYEIVTRVATSIFLLVCDQLMFSNQYIDFTPVSISPNLLLYQNPNIEPIFSFPTLENMSYKYNDLDVTNHRQYNVLYFTCPTLSKKEGQLGIVFSNAQSITNTLSNTLDEETIFFATFNEELGKFQIEFYVECNSPIDYFVFTMVANSKVNRSPVFKSQLRVKKSNLDLQGPIFKNIVKLPTSTIDKTNNIGEIGWRLSIQDTFNGFKSGYIVIKGELDQSIYNISIDANQVLFGNEFLGDYIVKIPIYYPCISQTYLISEVALYDKIGRNSYFATLNVPFPDYSSVSNPFINFLNDTSINKIQLTCTSDPIASLDTTPPILTLIKASKPSLDVDQPHRIVTIDFSVSDPESGIKNNTLPIVYFTAKGNRIEECISTIISINKTDANYTCTIDLPFGFGYPEGIILSIYGLHNNNGLFNGYSTQDLMDLFFTYSISTNFISSKPTILNHYRISEKGGNLWLFGRALDSGSSNAVIIFSDGSNIKVNSSISHSTAILFKNIPSTDKPYQLYINFTDSQLITNTITIYPTVYDFTIPMNPALINSQSSSSEIPPSTPLPTNAPQKCPGKPECGGSSNGKCITNQGCVCYSPWFGKDCLSQIVIIDPPVIGGGGDGKNNSIPSIEIIIPDNSTNNSNSSNSVVTYHSLISIVALREVNILGKTINYHQFSDNWTSKQIDTYTYDFYNQFNSSNKNNEKTTTDIIVTLKWFINEESITFANEELQMNPSSLKYTINISSYPFESELNELQLVMSALLSSNTTNNVCSSKEFGETSTGDNSNYIKIQVDNHSLYGRFIRRGIIDSRIQSVTNILLDSNMNPITTSTKIQTFIGIQIPNYKNQVILDPDFSVLIDSYSAKSICSSTLSGGKIAGIVIGGVAFVVIVFISIVYYIKKKQNNKKLISNIQNKINSMNNDKL